MDATVQVITTRMSGLPSCLIETVKACYDPSLTHPVILMMPENLTLNGEQEIIEHITGNGLLGIRIITPKTIADEITDRAGVPGTEPITDFGRAVVLSHVLKQLHRQKLLDFYDSAVRQSNLPIKLAEQIDEFRDAGLIPEELMKLADHPDIPDAMRYKYRDIAKIWGNYLTDIDNQFLDGYQQWEDLITRFKSSHYFDGADFIVVGFSMLNQQLMRLMAATAPLTASTRLIIVADEISADARIFASVNNQLLSFGQYLFNHGVRMTKRTYQLEHSDQNPGIRFIEQTLFAGGHRAPAPDMSAVAVYTASTPFTECQHAAQTLIEWHQQGMRWREMAVAISGSDILPDLLPMVLSDAGIPCTPPGGQSMLMNEYVQFVLCTVRAVCLGYLQADMLGLIKSGFCLETEDAMDMENYVIEHGITRQKWTKAFELPEPSDSQYTFVQRMEDMRQYIMDNLGKMRKQLADRKSTGADQARAIYDTMIRFGTYVALQDRERQYMERNMILEVDRNRQVWDSVNDVLDQIAVFSEKRHIALEELPAMLESAFAACVVKSLPQSSDAVTVNPMGMFFSSSIRGMIMLGMQDRDSSGEATLISDAERVTLRAVTKTPFGITRQEQAGIEMERISNTIASAKEKLVISCSLTKPDGSVLYPSSVMRMVSNILKSAGKEENITGGMLEDGIMPYSPSTALERLSVRLRSALQGQDHILGTPVPEPISSSVDETGADGFKPETNNADDNTIPFRNENEDPDRIWRAALAFLYHDPAWHTRTARMLQGLSAQIHVDDLTPSIAHRLYPETNLSVSRLETFASCPYRHFLIYGLRPVIRQPFSFMANMKGDFYHQVMEAYIRKASALPSWPNLAPDEMNGVLDEVIRPLTEGWQNGPLDIDALRHFHAQRIIRDVRHAAATITRNFSVSSFMPEAYELRFGRKTEGGLVLPPIQFFLSDRTKITLNGQIDRLDTFVSSEGIKYFRVVDYKSSHHVLRDRMLEEGLQMQFPIYMNAVQQSMPEAVPAGGLYQVIGNPLIEADDEDEALIVRKMGSELKLRGIVLDDKEVLQAMGEVNGHSRSPELVAAVSLDEIRTRMNEAMENAEGLTERIFNGCIQIAPVQYDENAPSPCQYCPGASVCGIDARLPGGRPRLLKPSNPGEETDAES
ncbi:MAG: PD-(D/E)XK nuclease family protein [Clostridia bacterium]|nr:PD-(D/E)XK nuclease family protein [Clostridia bacterium]